MTTYISWLQCAPTSDPTAGAACEDERQVAAACSMQCQAQLSADCDPARWMAMGDPPVLIGRFVQTPRDWEHGATLPGLRLRWIWTVTS